ncbi:T9SS type A sorting domain-containing protein [Flavobacterium sp.]|jgi:uncharacterized repeat protein (TIGR01451 family)|uniref:DUF7619 domain-containing protein n=1 Tax=Flavobacterium sp. TaxID=239 RepID=UPI0037C0DE93
MKKKLLILLVLLSVAVNFVSAQCLPPTNVFVSNITNNSATVSWVPNTTTTTSDYNIQLMMNGTVAGNFAAQTSPYVLTGLPCGTTCTLQIVSVCAPNVISVPSVSVTFTTASCPTQFGQPQNMTACVTNGFGCFNLASNTQNILANQPANLYTVSYHSSQADAVSGANPLVSPHCVNLGSYTVFSRVTAISSGNLMQVSGFTINAVDYQVMSALNPMVQCDDNNDQQVVFDLTTSQAVINSNNTLVYYPTLIAAQNQVNPISPATNFVVPVSALSSTIFIREIIADACDKIYPRTVFAQSNCNLASFCTNANLLCNSLGIPYTNTINFPNSGASGCLGTTPNPNWFYIPISAPGTINLSINQGNNAPSFNNQDVDYIIYGPFTSGTSSCNLVGPNNIVSCSYSASASENAVIPNAQAGQYYLMMITNFSNQNGFITINHTNSSMPGSGVINCTGFTFNAFLDSNNNGTKDTGEVNFPLGKFTHEKNDNGVVHNVIAPSGSFSIYDMVATNSYDVAFVVNPTYATMYNVNPSQFLNLTSTGSGMTTYNFPVTSLQNYNDLGVAVVPFNAPRPGFNYINRIVYANLGNQTITSGTVTFTKPSAVTLVSTTPASTSTATGFTLDFTNLLPFEVRTVNVNMLVPTIPTVNAGEFLVSQASIVPTTGDVVIENNSNTLTQMVINAYDPNDKMEARGPQILHSSFTSNDYLYYTIRFENTGNASAINVRINDVLNNKLDESTLSMISSSHTYELDRVGTELNWKFNNIQLPVSVANSTIGKGYVTFKIKPKAGYAVGDIIPNVASIYFDYNPAIVTNTFTTEFVALLESESFETNEFMVYPNPTNSILNIQSKNNQTISEVNVYDLLGKKLTNKKVTVSTTEIDLTNYTPGLYVLEVISADNQKSIHKIVKK